MEPSHAERVRSAGGRSLGTVLRSTVPDTMATNAPLSVCAVAIALALAVRCWSFYDLPSSPHTASPVSMSSYEVVSKLLTERASLREYADTPVPDEVIADLFRLTQRAPTAFNTQPYVAILVRSEEDKARLVPAMLATNQIKISGSAFAVVFAADLEPSRNVPRLQELMRAGGAPEGMVAALPNYLNNFSGEGTEEGSKSWAYKQTSIAAATFLYAATAKGLATCPMEGFNDAEVKKALGLTDRYSVPIIISVGYPKEGAHKRVSGRRPPTEIFFEGKLGGSTEALFETE